MYQGFVLYRQIWQCNGNITDYRGNGPWFYQLGVPTVRGFSRDQLDYSPELGGGGGGVVTNDWCISITDCRG